MLTFSHWFILVVSLINLSFVSALTSVPLGVYEDEGFQTHIFEVKSSGTAAAPLINSIPLVFKKAKQSPLSGSNILFGIYSMDYNLYRPISGTFEIGFYHHTISITQASLVVELHDLYSKMVMVKASLLIISNEYVHKPIFEIYHREYTYANFYQNQITLLTNYVPTVYHFLTGARLKTTSTNIAYTFDPRPYLGSIPNRLDSIVNVAGMSGLFNFLHLSIFVVYHSRIPAVPEFQIVPYNLPHTSLVNTASMTIAKKVAGSSLFYGINQFTYMISGGDAGGFRIVPSYASDILMNFQIDDQFHILKYQALLMNHFTCNDKTHFIFAQNTPSVDYRCFDECSTVSEYYAYDSTTRYYKCAVCQLSCATCHNATACKSCYDGYILSEGASCRLDPTFYMTTFLSVTAIDLCSKLNPACEMCTVTGLACLKCQPIAYIVQMYPMVSVPYTTAAGPYYYPTGLPTYSCRLCEVNWPNCISCNSTDCFACKHGYYLQDSKTCTTTLLNPPPIVIIKPCTDTLKCQFCFQANLDNCLKCFNPSHRIINGKCTNPCGDGLVIDQEVCDDGNNLSLDGCSSDCLTVEQNWTCQHSFLLGRTLCHYSQSIALETLSIKKTLNENKVTILMKNTHPSIREWMSFNSSELKAIVKIRVPKYESNLHVYAFDHTVRFITMPQKISAKNPLRLLQSAQDTFNQLLYECLEIELTYTSDQANSMSLNRQQLIVSLNPNFSKRTAFQATPPSDNQFELISDDNTLIQYFPESYYQSYTLVKLLSIMASVLVLIILLMSIVAFVLDGNNSRQILLAIETAGIVQFTYFSLLGVGELNPLFVAMTEGLKLSCGFDIALMGKKTSEKVLLGMGIDSTSMMDNANVSLGIVLVFLIVGLTMFVIEKIKKKKSLHAEQTLNQHQNMQNLEEEEKNSQKPQQQQNQQKSETKTKLSRLSKIFITNFSFGCFLFFLYKFTVFMAIQLKFGSMESMDTVVIALVGILLLSFTVLLFVKFDLFDLMTDKLCNYETFEEKEKRLINDDEDEFLHMAARAKRQKMYLLFLIVERIINSFTLIFLLESFSYHGLIPMSLLIGQFLYMKFYDKNVYNPPNKYRLYLNCFMGLIIQGMLMGMKIMAAKMEAGTEENEEGEYLPFSIMGSIFLVLLVSLSFEIYSIKRIRCVQLEIEWEKVDENRMKQVMLKQQQKKKKFENKKLSDQKQKSHLREFQDKKKVDESNFDHTQRNILSKKDENIPYKLQQVGQICSAKEYESIKSSQGNDELKEEEQFETEKWDKNINEKSKEGFETIKRNSDSNHPFTTRKEIKRDIRRKLQGCKVPKNPKEEYERKIMLLKKKQQAQQVVKKEVSVKEEVNVPYKYTDRYRYNLYETFDEI